MLVITRHSQCSTDDTDKTGVDIGKKHTLEIIEINEGVATISFSGIHLPLRADEFIQFGPLTIEMHRVGLQTVRIGINAPKNVRIHRWDQQFTKA